MKLEEIMKLIQNGEKIDIEFKESNNALPKNIYDSVCSFNNRNGGHILLGVNDEKLIVGVNEDKIDKIIKEFTTSVNNSQKIYPPLYLTPVPVNIKGKTVILSMTSAGIDPVTRKLAEVLDCEIVDGFKTGVDDNKILVAVIDCGGTARCGVYPKKKIFTVNVKPTGKTGPLAQFITEDLYVSGVTIDDIKILSENDESQTYETKSVVTNTGVKKPENYDEIKAQAKEQVQGNFIMRLGQGVGNVVAKFYEAGRETINVVIGSVLPFMAFVSMLMGIILASGLGDLIAKGISPLIGNIFGLIAISIICSLPFLSPILGPGAVIAQVVGTLIGTQIGLGHVPAYLALPALFAINGQVGCDFVPVGLSLGEAEPETIEYGVPALFYSRLITGPLAVVIAYVVAIIFF